VAHSKSANKRIRQNEKRRMKNRSEKSAMKTQIKKVQQAVEKGDKALAEVEAKAAVSLLDRAGHKRLIHPNNASRKKAQIAKIVAHVPEA